MLPRLNMGYHSIGKQRPTNRDSMRELQEPDTMDYHKVIKAKVDKISTKKKLINFSFMRKERPRDEFMYNQTDFLTNIKLDEISTGSLYLCHFIVQVTWMWLHFQ